MKNGKTAGMTATGGASGPGPERHKEPPVRQGLPGFREQLVRVYYSALENLLQHIIDFGISPNFITWSSLVISSLAAYCYSVGEVYTAALFLFLAGFLDTMDGTLARMREAASRYGALLDSTLDRYSEFFIFFGLLVYFRQDWAFFAVMLALLGSVMVSYIKARAQSLGQVRTVGLMQRPERLALIFFGSLLNPLSTLIDAGSPDLILKASLVLVAVLANMTAVSRLKTGKVDLSPVKE